MAGISLFFLGFSFLLNLSSFKPILQFSRACLMVPGHMSPTILETVRIRLCVPYDLGATAAHVVAFYHLPTPLVIRLSTSTDRFSLALMASWRMTA